MATKTKASSMSLDDIKELINRRDTLVKLLSISRGNSAWQLATNFMGQWTIEMPLSSEEVEEMISSRLRDINSELKAAGLNVDRDSGLGAEPINKSEPQPEPEVLEAEPV